MEKINNGFNSLIFFINRILYHIEDEEERRKRCYEYSKTLLITMRAISTNKQDFYSLFIQDTQKRNKEWIPSFHSNGELTEESINELVEIQMSVTRQGRINAGLDKEK